MSQAQGRSIAAGIGYIGGSRIASQVLQFVSSVALARLLTPSDYGVFAILVTAAALPGLINDLGLTEALVRWPQLGRREMDAGLLISIGVGVALFLLTFPAGWVLAAVFDDGRLGWLFPLFGVTFILNSNAVQAAILQRAHQFGLVALSELLNVAVTLGVSVLLAALGLGVLSLVLGSIVGMVVQTALLWGHTHWLPRLPRRRDVIDLLRGCSGNTTYAVTDWAGGSTDTFIIGFVSGTAALGAYSRAWMFSQRPGKLLRETLSRVLLPTFARRAADPEGQRLLWVRYTRNVLLICGPGTALLSVAAADLILSLYGEAWSRAGTYLTILAWGTPALAVSATTTPLIYAMARQRDIMTIGFARAGITVALVLAGVPFGSIGICYGVVAASYATLIPLLGASRGLIRLRLFDAYHITARPFLISVIVLVAVLPSWGMNAGWTLLLTRSAVGVVVWAVAAWILVPAWRQSLRTTLARR